MVDDEKPYLDFLAAMLVGGCGWDVRIFDRPRAALAALPEFDVGVIVTDYFMPEMNGIEFIRAATAICPGVPFILISGHAAELTEDSLVQSLPVASLLPKPFSWRQLADEIVLHAPTFGAPATELPSKSAGT